ncbi:NID1, partial [Branchiostoma lanceolatum]
MTCDFVVPATPVAAGCRQTGSWIWPLSNDLTLSCPSVCVPQGVLGFLKEPEVSTNGIISFGKAVSEYINERFPLDVSVISVFSTDVDTEAAGQVFYRETTDQQLLVQASTAVRTYFPDQSSDFTANALFIVTWVDVGYYPDGDDKRNTFQAVIATDGARQSFVFFHYEADGIQWWRTIQRPGRRSAGELPAQVGFNAGDGERFYLVPASGTDAVKNVNGWSNMNTGGAWLFQIGAFAGFQNIIPAQPKLESPIVDSDRSTSFNRNREPLVEVAPAPVDRTGQFNRDETPSNQDPFQVTFFNLDGQGQSSGCDSCHQNARCSRNGPISCCRCQEGFYGNGINCLPAGTPQRVNGKVEGTVRLSGKDEVDLRDIDLHSYVVVNDGRAYTAMSRIEENVGYAMQPLSTIGGIIGWLFGLPQANAVNGYTLTGGVFKRTAVVTFRPGNQVFQVEQDFQGVDEFGYLTMTTKLSGELPPIAAGDKVVVGEYQEIYQKTAPGLIKSIASRGYTVANRVYNYTWDQTIEYDEAGCNLPNEGLVTDSLRVDVSRNFVFFDNKEEIVRYAMTTKVSPMAGPPVAPVLNPCQTGQHDCHSHARCVALEGQQYTCECVGGYTGDGRNCQDIDECTSGTPPCAPNANCINEIGTFRCVCPPGYEGDGFSSCTPLSPQPSQNPCYDGTNDCDSIERARCIPLGAGRYRCECNPGFTGDGRACVEFKFEHPCVEGSHGCDEETSMCVRRAGLRYECKCLPGYREKGDRCVKDYPNPCNKTSCGRHAVCVGRYNPDSEEASLSCKCKPGFVEVAGKCRPKQSVVWKGVNTTKKNKTKTRRTRRDLMKIDSMSPASQLQNPCMGNRCDMNAVCIPNPVPSDCPCKQDYTCMCQPGFTGTGYNCRSIPCHSGESMCGINGVVRMIKSASHPVNPCFSGDHMCDINAYCVAGLANEYECKCMPGFSGTGFRCDAASPCTNHDCHPAADCVEINSFNFMCLCGPGYAGDGRTCVLSLDQGTSTDPCERNQCDPNAQCIPYQDRYSCRCNQGFQGNGLQCTPELIQPYDACAQNTCDLNADCIAIGSAYTCKCQPGYIGDGFACISDTRALSGQTRQSGVCGSAICDVNAICRDRGQGVYTCECKPGYRGDGTTCTAANACEQSNRCHERAECIPLGNSYTCRCQLGYTGDGLTCTSLATRDPCSPNPCGASNRCFPQGSSYRCQCSNGFQLGPAGTTCLRQAVDPCNPNPCDPTNGRCIPQGSTYQCACNPGFQLASDRRTCTSRQAVDPCSPNPCDPRNGQCIRQGSTYQCTCNPGFQLSSDRRTCTRQAVNPCSPNPCDPTNGRCIPQGSAYQCTCNPGFQLASDRRTCTRQAVDPCSPNPCDPTNGRCIPQGSTYQCTCNPGFQLASDRRTCTRQVVDPCSPNPCDPTNGRCVPQGSTYQCLCNPGYQLSSDRRTCTQLRRDPCQPNPCDPINAQCIPEGDNFRCICRPGFQLASDGRTCTEIDPCENNNCDSVNGRCLPTYAAGGVISFRCECNPGFQGDGIRCLRQDPCLNNDCDTANARCIPQGNTFTCQCNPGFQGDGRTCLRIAPPEPADPCENNDCDANARCNPQGNSYTCECKDGFQGDGRTCTRIAPVDPCANNDCDPINGQCVPLGSPFTCICNTGFALQGDGRTCLRQNPCLNNACDRNARCQEDALSPIGYQCVCNDGYLGNGFTCTVNDPCQNNQCDSNANCVPAGTSYRCACKPGYQGSGFSCTEVDPCDANNCDQNANCIREGSSFRCECKPPFTGNGFTCTVPNLCIFQPCDINADCISLPGSFSCRCRQGYQGDGHDCNPIR